MVSIALPPPRRKTPLTFFLAALSFPVPDVMLSKLAAPAFPSVSPSLRLRPWPFPSLSPSYPSGLARPFLLEPPGGDAERVILLWSFFDWRPLFFIVLAILLTLTVALLRRASHASVLGGGESGRWGEDMLSKLRYVMDGEGKAAGMAAEWEKDLWRNGIAV